MYNMKQIAIAGFIALGSCGQGQIDGMDAKVRSSNKEDSKDYSKVIKRSNENIDIAIGRADAPVLIVNYFQPLCSSCAATDRDFFPILNKNYIESGLVQYTYRGIAGRHAYQAINAVTLIIASCSETPEGQLNIIRSIFNDNGPLDILGKSDEHKLFLQGVASENGIEADAFKACMDNKSLRKKVLASIELATEDEVNYTPSLFINGSEHILTKGPSTYVEVFDAIDALLGDDAPDRQPILDQLEAIRVANSARIDALLEYSRKVRAETELEIAKVDQAIARIKQEIAQRNANFQIIEKSLAQAEEVATKLEQKFATLSSSEKSIWRIEFNGTYTRFSNSLVGLEERGASKAQVERAMQIKARIQSLLVE